MKLRIVKRIDLAGDVSFVIQKRRLNLWWVDAHYYGALGGKLIHQYLNKDLAMKKLCQLDRPSYADEVIFPPQQ